MRISELIQVLQTLEDRHGNVFVELANGTEATGVSAVFQEGTGYDPTKGETPPVVAVTVS